MGTRGTTAVFGIAYVVSTAELTAVLAKACSIYVKRFALQRGEQGMAQWRTHPFPDLLPVLLTLAKQTGANPPEGVGAGNGMRIAYLRRRRTPASTPKPPSRLSTAVGSGTSATLFPW
jgi:hypothetical protein